MPFTLVAYSASQTNAALTAVAALPDNHITVAGNDVRIPDWAPLLLGVYGMGTAALRYQMQSPSLRRLLNLEVGPFDAAVIPANPPAFMDMFQTPVPLLVSEGLNAFETDSGAGRHTVLAWLGTEAPQPVLAPVFTVRVTAAATLVANQWTNSALTFDQVLPPGQYQIVGAQFASTNLQAFRFVIPGFAYRPGGPGTSLLSRYVWPWFRRGRLGVWGTFTNIVPPTVDFLANAADTSESGILDLVKVS